MAGYYDAPNALASVAIDRAMKALSALACAATLLASCDTRSDAGPVVVSAIGDEVALSDPARGTLDHGRRLLLDATAQGLVRFDAAGQIEPGLAERWIVTDDGMSYIFRIREMDLAGGKRLDARSVQQALGGAIRSLARDLLFCFVVSGRLRAFGVTLLIG